MVKLIRRKVKRQELGEQITRLLREINARSKELDKLARLLEQERHHLKGNPS